MNDVPSEDLVREIIKRMGDDPSRPGLQNTPDRVVASWDEIVKYAWVKDPLYEKEYLKKLLKLFDEPDSDEMIVCKDIEFYSTCLVGSTFVDTPRGRIPISRIEDGEFVYCWDEDECRMTLARASNPRVTGINKTLWRIYTDKDTILCTGNHKFLTHEREWVEARNLTVGDSVVALNKGSIVHPGGKTRAYVVWTGQSKQVPEHKFVYEEINGRVSRDVHIHHVNKKPNDNRPENLTALGIGEHSRLHRTEDGPTGFALFTDAQRKAMKEKQIARIKESQTEEVKRKRSESLKKYWATLTPEEKFKRNHRVLMVEKTDWREDVWCMDVPGYENFVANGMVVHNCEHHLLPFYGVAHVTYIPSSGKVVGLSKLARLVEFYSRRLQVQERISKQVTRAIQNHVPSVGAACVIEATHLCMCGRGVKKQGSKMVTCSLSGALRTDASARAEFYSCIRGGHGS